MMTVAHTRAAVAAVRRRLGLDGAAEPPPADPGVDTAVAAAVGAALGDLLAAAVRRRLAPPAPDDPGGGPWAAGLLAALGPDAVGRAIHEAVTAAVAPPPAPPTGPAAFQYLPVPDGPDRHDEAADGEAPDAPPGLRLIGARVRGKKHKHDGTHCDDWFEFARAGRWTVAAVADGAGSRPLSRLGARAACREAVAALTAALPALAPLDRPDVAAWNAALARGPDGAFAAADLDAVRAALWEAFRRAARAVEAEAARAAAPGPPADAEALACTLLVAVHAPAGFGGERRDLVLTCAVGDGLIAALHTNGTPIPLADPDGGEFAGQTQFLTAPGQCAAANLARKTFVGLCRLGALFLMTDGVADDYDPPRDHLPRLWADLVVNGVPDLVAPAAAAVEAALAATPAPTLEAVARLPGLDACGAIVGPPPRDERTVRCAAALARGLGRTVADLVRQPALLWAGRAAPAGRPIAGPTAAARLRQWLDAYHVRGSFDDRTLVALYREDWS